MIEPRGRRATVMGLGRFGGGVGVTRWLAEQGADVLVTDSVPAERLAEPLSQIHDLTDSGRVRLRLGSHREEDFRRCDMLVVNPAVPKPWSNACIDAARDAGAAVTTEISLLVERLPSRRHVVGVTGSAGKSTTAAMIASTLRTTGRTVHLGGNIGGSLLASLARIGSEDAVVLELSSAMLHWLSACLPGWAPGVAVVTNLEPNHLDWHGSLEHYRRSKQRITTDQRAGDAAVLGPTLGDWPTANDVHVRRTRPEDAIEGLSIPGRHNAMNATLALEAARAFDTSLDSARATQALRTFRGLPHRLCFLGERRGVKYFDDSKSTTPRATLLAIEAFAERGELGRVHLIAGGYDKGSDLSPIADRAADLAGLWCIGATGPGLAGAVGSHAVDCTTLDRAMQRLAARVRRGDVVLLSPGCASWDQFDNFAQRGREFARLAGLGDHG